MDLEKALYNPAAYFKTPAALLRSDLSREQKIEALRRWEYDARLLQVAEEENMPGPQPDLLGDILNALNSLGADPSVH
jgi:hypothetical protein